jgi:threonine synthase
MLKTYRIIPLVFILFFFGFTFITVAPVIAEDSPEFVACQQIKPNGGFRLMKQKKNCFRDVARLFQGQSGDSVQAVVPVESSGGEVAQLNARIVESESQVATLTTTNAQLQEQLRSARSQTEALVAKTSELEVKIATPRDAEQVVEEICLSNMPLWEQLSRIQIKKHGKWTVGGIFSALRDQCTPRNARLKLQHILEDQKRLSGR